MQDCACKTKAHELCCDYCQGLGKILPFPGRLCPVCWGTGRKPYTRIDEDHSVPFITQWGPTYQQGRAYYIVRISGDTLQDIPATWNVVQQQLDGTRKIVPESVCAFVYRHHLALYEHDRPIR